MRIAIITDGSNNLGLGHVYQSITLAHLIMERTNSEAEIYFITKSNGQIVDLLKKTNCTVQQYPDDKFILDDLINKQPDKIIFDKLDVSPELAMSIKKNIRSRLIIFTNLTEANRFADITVMAGIGSKFKNIYKKNEQTNKIEFWGPKYFLLRPEFTKYQKKRNSSFEKIKNILLIFGGSDQSNLSTLVLEKLIQSEDNLIVTIILGIGFENHDDLNHVIQHNIQSNTKIIIKQNVTNVSETMYNNDVVFVSPGLSFFEALSVGTPVICFHQNEFQKDAWNGYIKTYDKSEISEIPSIVKNGWFIFPDDPFIVSLEIGKGKDEILDEILN